MWPINMVLVRCNLYYMGPRRMGQLARCNLGLQDRCRMGQLARCNLGHLGLFRMGRARCNLDRQDSRCNNQGLDTIPKLL